MWINKKYYEEFCKLSDMKDDVIKRQNNLISKFDEYIEAVVKKIDSQNECIKQILNKSFVESDEFEYVMLKKKNERPIIYKNGKEIKGEPKRISMDWCWDADGMRVDFEEI